ncbi:MAG: metalloregulator ArsR/SmtB family transcription factor [Dehalococcoidales bacterium]|nr:metalloregulator ArsR/SmtB family transcription factor [Dehalococcoidales bacterium]
MTAIEKQATLFSVLADPTRLKLLRLLAEQQEPNALCVNALAYRLGVTQSAVSQHLKVLKSAGMVKGEKRGYRVHYFVNKEGFKSGLELVTAVLDVDNIVQTKSEIMDVSLEQDKKQK